MTNYTISEGGGGGGGVGRLNTDGPVQRSYITGREQCPRSCTNVGQASMAGLSVSRECWFVLNCLTQQWSLHFDEVGDFILTRFKHVEWSQRNSTLDFLILWFQLNKYVKCCLKFFFILKTYIPLNFFSKQMIQMLWKREYLCIFLVSGASITPQDLGNTISLNQHFLQDTILQ